MPIPRLTIALVLIGGGAFALPACTRNAAPASTRVLEAAPQSPATARAEQIGAMRDVMRDGRTEARVRLRDLPAGSATVAVGALEGLSGEITAVDGEFWVTRVQDGQPRTTGPRLAGRDAATLLTHAAVPGWRSRDIQAGGRELAQLVREEATRAGVDLDEPFPFVIETTTADLKVHVINGHCPMSGLPETAGTTPWRWSGSTATDIRLVGFLARDRAGVMTHHGTDIHAHVVFRLDGRTISAHIDHATIPGIAVLRLPAALLDAADASARATNRPSMEDA